MTEKIASFEEFWPYYLNEHRDAISRRLHFAGTSGWLASAAVSTATSPVAFPLVMAVFAKLLKDALDEGESEKPSWKRVAGMLALPTMASPIAFPAGVVFAYGCAWLGHFRFEKNKPASWRYPLWSLTADWKMWAEMLQGRLWNGDDPVAELGLEDKRAPEAPRAEPTIVA